MPRLASFSTRDEGGVVVIGLDGEVDRSNASELLAAIAASVPNGAAGVVLDCEDVRYLDSSGLHFVANLANRLDSRRQRLTVVAAPGSGVRQVLDLCRFDQLLTLAPNLESALATQD